MTDFVFPEKVTWTTPMYGLTRYGYVIEQLRNGSVRVTFGNDGMDVRDLPARELQHGWVPPDERSGLARDGERA